MWKPFRLFPCVVALLILGAPCWAQNEKPAEIQTPGPALTASQKDAMQALKADAEKRAAPIAASFADIVKRIYENMLADKPDEKLGRELSNQMRDRTWELLSIKGEQIRETVKLLTPAQKSVLRAEMAKPGAPSDLTELIARLFSPER